MGSTADTCGTVFSLSPPAHSGGKWPYRTLYAFSCASGAPSFPRGSGLIVGAGVIYGTTSYPYTKDGGGAVFELTRPSKPGAEWNLDLLHHFAGQAHKDGSAPDGDLVAGTGGILFGTTGVGGTGPCIGGGDSATNGCGTVWQL
jgi:hypothetical protein